MLDSIASVDINNLSVSKAYEFIEIIKKQVGKIEGKIETAKKLLEKGMDIDSIIEVTDLGKEEIEKIIAENK